MGPNLQNLRSEIVQRLPDGWETITTLLYEFCAVPDIDSGEFVRQQHSIIAEYTKELPFIPRDRILSAVNAVCAEYERAGFANGLVTGAKLILDLLEWDV